MDGPKFDENKLKHADPKPSYKSNLNDINHSDLELQAYFSDRFGSEKSKHHPTEHLKSEAIILSSMQKHKAVELKHWKYKGQVSSKLNHTLPTVILHGIKQSCSEKLLTDLVESVQKGTESYTECVEVGDGYYASMLWSMAKQSKEACAKIQNHFVFGL